MLTDTQVRAARATENPYKLADSRGLYLQVNPNGGRYWRFNYRFNGKQKTLALGTYPDVSLARARERHYEARRELAEGVDPSAAKQALTRDFETVARAWLAHWRPGRSERYVDYVVSRLECDIFPDIGARPVAELTAAEFRDAVRKVERRGAAEIARRLLQNCGQIMRYAVANDLAPRNPVAEVKPSDILKARKKRNYPRVTAKELPDLLRAIEGYAGSEHTRLALQLMALSFVRTSELIGARWPEFDLKESRWDIPAERMKMKTPHVVALSRQAKEVVERLQSISFDREFVFPGEIWPSEIAWTGEKPETGWFRAPRTLPLILMLLSSKSVNDKADLTGVYIELLARHRDSGIVDMVAPGEHSYAAGYTGTRGIRTWQERMKILEELGFIKTKMTGNQQYKYVLLVHPTIAVQRLRDGGKVPDDWWDTRP